MAAKKEAPQALLSPLFTSSTFTLDIEIDPEFLKNLSIGPAITADGKPVLRLQAARNSGKLCVNLPPKIGRAPSNDCGDRRLVLIVDEAATKPWRVRLARTKAGKKK